VVKLLKRTVRLDRRGRFGIPVSCGKGTPSCRVRVLVKRGATTVGTRTITVRGGRSYTLLVRPTESMRRSLKRGRSVTVRVSYTPTGSITAPRPTNVTIRPAARR
jgi:hypothetical protein